MTEWWTEPYKGGKMVVPQAMFPRPLYPPDSAAKGKTPSVDGPDVEAYKRTVSRAGRWPWQTFNRAFTNEFSHGEGGNVINSGIAGIQRQSNIDPTGWIGQKTFNLLCSIRVPVDLPHGGEMAMDVTAQNLIAEAFTMFGGNDPVPPPPTPTTTRENALAGATRHIGYKESPAGTNHTKFGAWYGVDYQPWCAIFTTWCYVIEAGGSPSFARGSKYAYVPYIVSDAKNKRNGLSVPNSPLPGDLVCYDWGRDGTYDHVGLFENWTGTAPSQFFAIEGNTSDGNNSNGGEVMRRTRDSRMQNTVFVRVAQ